MRRYGSGLLAATALLACPALAACAGSSDPEPLVIEITEQRTFAEAAVTVPAGTEIRWVNHAGRSQTVTSDTGQQRWDHTVYPGEVVSVQLDRPGDYLYFCRFHRDDEMIGAITVEEP